MPSPSERTMAHKINELRERMDWLDREIKALTAEYKQEHERNERERAMRQGKKRQSKKK